MNMREEMAEIIRDHVDQNVTYLTVADAIIRRVIELGPSEEMIDTGNRKLFDMCELRLSKYAMNVLWRAMWEVELGK